MARAFTKKLTTVLLQVPKHIAPLHSHNNDDFFFDDRLTGDLAFG